MILNIVIACLMRAPQGPSPPHVSPHYPMPASATCASTCIRQAQCQCGAASKIARWLPPADFVRERKGSAPSSRGAVARIPPPPIPLPLLGMGIKGRERRRGLCGRNSNWDPRCSTKGKPRRDENDGGAEVDLRVAAVEKGVVPGRAGNPRFDDSQRTV
jgi:hypothetical protein